MTPRNAPRLRFPRRGLTLVEMMVSVALLVLMMTVIVQVFAAATGAVTAQRAFQELDGSLRQIDITLRQDLGNVTAKLTPPLNPADNLGYFEYGENSFADNQMEDTDDYIRFTTKAPEGQVFTGRMYIGLPISSMSTSQALAYFRSQPITIASQYAEVIYFLRNGNLYRRVLLVAPEKQSAIDQTSYIMLPPALGGNGSSMGVSWQGVNDLSAHPAATANNAQKIILNTLGDLTNRENRPFYQRWANDFDTNGIPDDQNGDSVPDFYPSLYAGVFSASRGSGLVPPVLVNEIPVSANHPPGGTDVMLFPYIFPGAYSYPDPTASSGLGWIHTPDANLSQLTLAGLNALNHNPFDNGDSLPYPQNSQFYQTWWGFPTWRETMNLAWIDPANSLLTLNGAQTNGLHWHNPTVFPLTAANSPNNLLPPMTGAFRIVPQPFTDGAGAGTFAVSPSPPFPSTNYLWNVTWEDDLILTGVRSFDVKAYDDSYGGYVDLGWGDDLRQYVPYASVPTAPPYLSGTAQPFYWPPGGASAFDLINQSYAHEGRIPPLTADLRPDAQFPLGAWIGGGYLATNVGDDNANVVRLRRVWDTWSTDYSHAPATGINPNNSGMPTGPPFGPPIYPSYPAPYPMPLRGIQIQIRVTDPRNERIKVLTIRQDFSDKL